MQLIAKSHGTHITALACAINGLPNRADCWKQKGREQGGGDEQHFKGL